MSTELGCYGMPSVHSRGSPTCSRCSGYVKCGEAAYKVLQVTKKTGLPVEHLIRDFELSYATPEDRMTTQLSAAQIGILSYAPAKLAGRLRHLFLESFDKIARHKLSQGVNPFSESGAKHLHLAGSLLIAGGFSRAEFHSRCIDAFGWTTGTASVEVSQALTLMKLLGIVEARDGRFVSQLPN